MELEFVRRRENSLLKREEVIAKIKFKGGTPSRKEIREILAKQLGKAPGNIFIRRISTEYGKEEATVMAMVYHSRAMALLIEPKHIIRRDEGGEAA
jgi:small subunit ribosomal protein S24e